MKVFRSMVLDAPLAQVWTAVRAFDAVVDWNPGVVAARMESGSPTAVGSVRHLDIADGTVFRETLLAHSDLEHFYTYDIVEGSLPCRSYISTHRFIAITEGDRTLGLWHGEFDCDRDPARNTESMSIGTRRFGFVLLPDFALLPLYCDAIGRSDTDQ